MRASRKLAWVAGVLVALFLVAGIGFYERPVSFFNHLLYTQMDLAGAHSRWATVNGIRIHYYDQGPENGPPVVLVHGLGGHAEDWRNLTPYLLHAGFRVIMPDLPGFGRSEQPQSFSYSIPEQAAVVVGLMDEMGLKQVDLGGHSMGGWIAQRIAHDHPERVKKLMLFDSAGLDDKPAWDTGLFTPSSAAQLDQLDALLFPHPPEVPAFIARDLLRISRQHAWLVHRALSSMLSGRDVTNGELPQLKMPVLIVWGALDKITPLEQGEEMHKLVPQSQLEVVTGCGHLAPVQCADRIGQTVEEFLK